MLPTTGVDGVFYLTEDTHRLYVGQGENHPPILLNRVVESVSTTADLANIAGTWTTEAAKRAHQGDFYYITTDNILATYRPSLTNPSAYEFV